MKDEPDQNELRELRGLLSRLPDAPLASNFTARVMQAVEREESRPAEPVDVFRMGLARAFAARGGGGGRMAAAGLAFSGTQPWRSANNWPKMSRSWPAQPMPSVEALQNFDAIRRMSQPVHADEGLLALAPDLK